MSAKSKKKSWREKLADDKDLSKVCDVRARKRTLVADHEKKLFTKLA